MVVHLAARSRPSSQQLPEAERAEFLESARPRPSPASTSSCAPATSCSGSAPTSPSASRSAAPGPIHKGSNAPQAAGVIHTDFESGFIKAEVMRWEDLVKLGSEAAVQEKGLLRIEGKEYVVQDGD